ncbi:MAG TPA: hypothetical protein VMU48_08175, partial [Terracidiphilus sp.]|nr:hypothetical protein [Terracidiphilus sp.]
TGSAVWTNSVDVVGKVEKRDVPAVVAAMNGTMGRAIEKLLTPEPAVSSEQPMTAIPSAE